MLSVQENERLTRVGPGTPMGELLRRYWFPVATSFEMTQNPTKSVRILGESLTAFKDRQGRLGLVAQRCAHRRVDLKYGIPENEGLRCPYHGWMYDTQGQCLEMPAEDPQSTFANRVKITSYPVEELGGLVWAYLGPTPAPILPRWDVFAYDNVFRQIGTTVLNANWLQCQENSVDTVHTEYLHGHLAMYVLERLGVTDPNVTRRFKHFVDQHHTKLDFRPAEYGIQKYRLREGQSEDSGSWQEGHPLVFPNYVLIGQPGHKEMQIRVPMDDTHTWHLSYQIYFGGPGVEMPVQDPVPSFEAPILDLPDYILGQDMVVWPAQGEIVDRSVEKLAATDRGLIMFRKMLADQIEIVEDGGDPMNVFRDPESARFIKPHMEDYGPLTRYQRGLLKYANTGPLNTVIDQLDDLLAEIAEANSKAVAT